MTKRWMVSLIHATLVVFLALAFVPIDRTAADAQQRKKAGPCADDLFSCPTHGCATRSPEALVNKQKRSLPPSGKALMLTLDDFDSLQDQADKLVGQKVALNATARKKLEKLTSSAGQVKEGDLVQIVGYMVGLPNRPNANTSGESVNCRLKGRDNNDFHPHDSEFEAIVVEVIPQRRNKEWTVPKLKQIAKEGRLVLVRGQLFYDNMHLINADPDDPVGGQPKRFSLWEVHPVTEFYICRTEKKCDTQVISQWEALEKVEE
jgi:hypothetical protein